MSCNLRRFDSRTSSQSQNSMDRLRVSPLNRTAGKGTEMERMRTLERVVETRIDMLEFERADEVREDCPFCRSLDCDIIFALLFTLVIACLLVLIMVFWLKGVMSYEELRYQRPYPECDHLFDSSSPTGPFSFPILPKSPTSAESQPSIASIYDETETTPRPMVISRNMQCIYTFVAGEGSRVKLDFEQFQLAGTSENCESEYVDIYSELERADENLLFARLGGRYCGSVSPHVRISLHNILVLVFHSRVGDASVPKLRFKGNYSFIPEARYIPGVPLPPGSKCSFLIESSQRKRGTIYSPTYPGTYPKNFHCSYLLKGKPGQRIRLMFRDFDIYFGGEHCPYDSVTVYDGDSTSSPIIKKVCGLQQRMEQFSVGPELLIHFNATDPPKADPRGYVIEYEFSSRFVDVAALLSGERGVTHMRGTECNVRVESNRETTHFIHSPKYPDLYPANTTCTYILDGLQGDQNLEKVIVTFVEFAVISELGIMSTTGSMMDDDDPDFITCPNAYVGIAINDGNMKATLSSTDESNFDHTLCERFDKNQPLAGPYVSSGPRMVLQFGTTEKLSVDGKHPLGFKARIDFKTDFGIPGEPVADSNVCAFRFRSKTGFFNSPRYPANYPLDTNCTYDIIGQPGQMILIHFEQFALEPDDKSCKDFLEIHDIFYDEGGHEDTRLQARYCANAVPGPRFSAFGSHQMRVFFSSNSAGTGNGFKLLYEMRAALKEEIPGEDGILIDPRHCGNTTVATDDMTYGYILSPGYGANYKKDTMCDWEIIARPGYQILLTLIKLDVEGSMKDGVINCQKAVIRVQRENDEEIEICGQSMESFRPLLSYNGSIRLSFITAPDKVNGLSGFSFSWTETKVAKDYSECSSDTQYLCTYSKLCIAAALRCNGKQHDCGYGDDTDETHCDTKVSDSNWIIMSAFIFSGGIFLFIILIFCMLFKKKLEKKKRRKRRNNRAGVMTTSTRSRGRQPYRGSGHKPPVAGQNPETIILADDAASRFVHHDAMGILPPTKLRTIGATTQPPQHTFYG